MAPPALPAVGMMTFWMPSSLAFEMAAARPLCLKGSGRIGALVLDIQMRQAELGAYVRNGKQGGIASS